MKKLRQIYFKNLKEPMKCFLALIFFLIMGIFAITTVYLLFNFVEKYPLLSCFYFFSGWSIIIIIIVLINIFVKSYKEFKEQDKEQDKE